MSIQVKSEHLINQGKKWEEEEIQRLLQAVRRKETIEQIAINHKRTSGGIHSRLKQLAADYYFYDNRPIEDIMKFTGLDKESILDAISKRQYQIVLKEQEKKTTPQQKVVNSQPEDTVSLLIEIRDLMKEMISIMKKT